MHYFPVGLAATKACAAKTAAAHPSIQLFALECASARLMARQKSSRAGARLTSAVGRWSQHALFERLLLRAIDEWCTVDHCAICSQPASRLAALKTWCACGFRAHNRCLHQALWEPWFPPHGLPAPQQCPGCGKSLRLPWVVRRCGWLYRFAARPRSRHWCILGTQVLLALAGTWCVTTYLNRHRAAAQLAPPNWFDTFLMSLGFFQLANLLTQCWFDKIYRTVKSALRSVQIWAGVCVNPQITGDALYYVSDGDENTL